MLIESSKHVHSDGNIQDQTEEHQKEVPQLEDKHSYSVIIMMLHKACRQYKEYTYIFKINVMSTLITPTINATFTKNEDLDWTNIHRRLGHISYNKLVKVCAQPLMEGIPKAYPTKARVP